MSEPCACWWGCALHEGHCCMTDENTAAECHPEMVQAVLDELAAVLVEP